MQGCLQFRRCETASWQPASWPQVRQFEIKLAKLSTQLAFCEVCSLTSPVLVVHCLNLCSSTPINFDTCSLRADGRQRSPASVDRSDEDRVAGDRGGARLAVIGTNCRLHLC